MLAPGCLERLQSLLKTNPCVEEEIEYFLNSAELELKVWNQFIFSE